MKSAYRPLSTRMTANLPKKSPRTEIFDASEIPLLNMSGMYAETIRDTHINRFG